MDWYPWCNEAFERARREDKPVFLSIGYSTCHWCHVMAHESFEDMHIADLLNQYFIAVKVDKEERPDIDSIYMAVCQALTFLKPPDMGRSVLRICFCSFMKNGKQHNKR